MNTTTNEAPATRARGRRIALWAGLALAVVVIAILLSTIRGSLDVAAKSALDPTNPAPDGTLALAEVLIRDGGVEVATADSFTQAASDSAGQTLVVGRTPGLTEDAFAQLISRARVVVLIDPTASQLRIAMDGERAGRADENLDPECALDLFDGLGSVTVGATYSIPDGVGCFPHDEGFGVIALEAAEQTVIAIDGARVMTNESITQGSNAALSLRLLGQTDRVTWYVPSAMDGDVTGEPSMGELTPAWVTPLLVLGTVTALVAIVWRGQRFGPLVRERLPVSVRISETLEGRAKLYARSRDTAHTAEILREASKNRIAKMLGLGRTATRESVAAALTSLGMMNAAEAHDLLAGSAPTTDAELMRLSDRLMTLENALAAAIHNERTQRD